MFWLERSLSHVEILDFFFFFLLLLGKWFVTIIVPSIISNYIVYRKSLSVR